MEEIIEDKKYERYRYLEGVKKYIASFEEGLGIRKFYYLSLCLRNVYAEMEEELNKKPE